MSIPGLQALLDHQPMAQPSFPPSHEAALQRSIQYLASEAATRSIELNPYWPKWDSPWWHMALLYEMGEASRIPKTAALRLLAEAKRTQLPYFFQADEPPGKKPYQESPCPCSLGNLFQILSAAGLDVEDSLPWARDWFVQYQMPDGGMSCDEGAYRSNPPASSLVGTVAPLEAMLLFAKKPLTAKEEKFLDDGARCLIERKLMLGCSAAYNAEEREDEPDWLKPCFPRFYFYDVLRGLSFILRWAESRKRQLPSIAIQGVVAALCGKFPDGEIRSERLSYEGVASRIPSPSGEWTRSPVAGAFPLLTQVSEVGRVSPYLTAQWNEAKARLRQLIRAGWIA